MSAEAVRTLRLQVLYDAQRADAASKKHHDAEQKRIRETANAQRHEEQEYIKAVKLKLKAETDLAKEIERRIKEREREEERASHAYIKSVKAQLRAEKELEKEKERATRQAERDREKEERDYIKSVKAQLRAEKELEKEKERAIKQAQRDQDKADREYIKAVKLKIRAEKDLEEQQEKQFQAQLDSIMKVGRAITALSTGALAAFAAQFGKVREDAFHAAEDVMRMRGAVRELQALRGELGDTGAGMAHIVKGAAKTLQTPEEYQAMEAAGRGIAELAIAKPGEKLGNGKVMTSAEFEEALGAAGKMQAMEGGDAGGAGKLMGQIVLQSKGRLTPAEAEGIYNKLYEIQKPGGFVNLTQAATQFAGMNGLVKNGIYSREEAMSLLSAFSVANPQEAESRAQQFTRAMMAGRIRNRGMPAPKGINITKSADYFKSIGITDQDTVMERGAKISDDLIRQEAAAKAAGKKFFANEYLMTHGIVNMEDAQAIMIYSGLRKEGNLANIETAAKAPLDKGAISRQFEERRRSDARLRRRTLELTEQAQRLKTGEEENPLIEAQKQAFNEYYAAGKITGSFDEWKNKGTLERIRDNLFYSGPKGEDIMPFGGYHNQINKRAQEILRATRRRMGLPAMPSFSPAKTMAGAALFGMFGRSEEDMMLQSAREIREHGGDVLAGSADKLNKAADNLERATRRLGVPVLAMPNPKNR